MIVSRKENLGTLKYRYVIFSHLLLVLKAVMGSSELCTKQFNVSGFFLYKKMVLYDDILLGNVTVYVLSMKHYKFLASRT